MTKCKICKSEFVKRGMQSVCSPACALELVQQKKAKAQAKLKHVEAQAIKARKEAIKTRSEWMKEAQSAFNKYIRLRDYGQSCICCGMPLQYGSVGGGYDAGHYRSVGSAPHLRFHEDNVHAQRKQCNRYGSGRAVDYRIGLIQRIGLDRVEALEADNSSPKYTIEDLKEIKNKYSKLARDLEKEIKSR